jgi:hypothetical protein
MPDVTPGGGPPAPVPKVLRCFVCGRTVTCSDDDATAYAKAGWPRCCGETMTLFTATDLPTRPAGPGD